SRGLGDVYKRQACACGDKFALAGKVNDKERLMEGVVMRDIHPFTAPHNERAADSGNTATPMPLAIAAVSVAIDSISPITFAVSRRREKASSTRSLIAL
ncbi:unnamed protein product, partial [Auanema sp. JU1783]